MKNTGSYIIVSLLAVLFCGVVLLTIHAVNQDKTLRDKDQTISTLKHLQTVNERVSSKKDSLLKLNDLMIQNCTGQVQHLLKSGTRNPTITGFSFGDKNVSVEELLKITNNALKENQLLKHDLFMKDFKLRTMKDKFGLSFKDTTNSITLEDNPSSLLTRIEKLQSRNDSLRRDLELKKRILDLIDRNYHIPYTVKGGTISIHENKIDSLLDVYPLIKKRIRIKDGKVWLSTF